jgi:hypothetical protein
MSGQKIEITPSVTVHNLLEAYPELEDVLIGMAPPFKKLKNPLLRRSVAKVATIKHISSVGNVPLAELIDTLRKYVGQEDVETTYKEEDYFQVQPTWYSPAKISVSIEEGSLEDEEKMTLVRVLREGKNVKEGEIIELVTSFLPAPGIDILTSKGYSVWTVKKPDGNIVSYFLKNS